MASFQVHTAPRGPHWIAWITRDGVEKPHRSVILIARTEEEAAARAREWGERASD
jgi:hypothetical protein